MEDKNKKKLNVGKDSVVIGNIAGDIGEGCVIIGATDERGNVILNNTMAIGRGAFASEGSIAIGAFAGAGSEKALLLHEIKQIIEQTGDANAITIFNNLYHEVNKSEPEKNKLREIWEQMKNIGAANGMIGLGERLAKFAEYINPYI